MDIFVSFHAPKINMMNLLVVLGTLHLISNTIGLFVVPILDTKNDMVEYW
jgi:hypothetical protein